MDSDLGPFIASIREHACLWNPEQKTYYDAFAREAAWSVVVKQHSIADVATAKRNWKALRDTHREVMKRNRGTRGLPRAGAKPWRYLAHMRFLLPHIGGRLKNDLPRPDRLSAATRTRHRSSEDWEPASFLECKMELPEVQSGSECAEDKDAACFARREGSLSQSPDAEDLMVRFFSAMCETAKRLPELYQLEIKRKLFDAVSDAEERYLNSHGECLQRDREMTS